MRTVPPEAIQRNSEIPAILARSWNTGFVHRNPYVCLVILMKISWWSNKIVMGIWSASLQGTADSDGNLVIPLYHLAILWLAEIKVVLQMTNTVVTYFLRILGCISSIIRITIFMNNLCATFVFEFEQLYSCYLCKLSLHFCLLVVSFTSLNGQDDHQ